MIVIQEPAEPFTFYDQPLFIGLAGRVWERDHVVQTLMVTLVVVVLDILRHRLAQRLFPEENEVLQALAFDETDKAFGIAVLLRAAYTGTDHLHAGGFQGLTEGPRKERIVIADKILDALQVTVAAVGQVAGHLRHDLAVDLATQMSDFHLAAAQGHDEKDLIAHQPAQRPDLGSEEVGHRSDVQLRADETPPVAAPAAFRRRADAFGPQDVAHRGHTYGVAEIGQCSLDAAVAPARVLLGELHAQLADDRHALLAVGVDPAFGRVFKRYQLAVPGQDRFRRHQRSVLFQLLPAQRLAPFGQLPPLPVVQAQLFAGGFKLFLQHPIFRQQILNHILLFAVHPTRHHGHKNMGLYSQGRIL